MSKYKKQNLYLLQARIFLMAVNKILKLMETQGNTYTISAPNKHKLSSQTCAGTQQCSWLRHYATSQKVMGMIPGEVIGFFN
jgi:hypothetical protein